jgi:uncharacterized protein (TIGR03435 family)
MDEKTLKPNQFDIVSIRKNVNPANMRLQFTQDGFIARGVTIRQLIQFSYAIKSFDQLSGLPFWAESDCFDIEAKVDDSEVPDFETLSFAQRRLLVQSMLKDRFLLRLHQATAVRPVYELVKSNGGAKLNQSAPPSGLAASAKGNGLVKRRSQGVLEVEGFTMDDFADYLWGDRIVERPVINRTHLLGKYDIKLHWIPSDASQRGGQNALHGPDDPSEPGAQSTIYSDIQKQAGLRLIAAKGPVIIFVIDRVQAPTGN